MPIAAVVELLPMFLERPVVDMTGLKGTYDIDITWTQDEHPGDGRAVDTASDPGPSIFTVLQDRLGLKLESKPAPIEVLVIDHVEKVPTEN
jgi:uncharacterized protein (TIGR03435 family)